VRLHPAEIKPFAPQALNASFSIGAKSGMAAAISGAVDPNPLRYCSVTISGSPRTAEPLIKRTAF
jgi:hypothetical protein